MNKVFLVGRISTEILPSTTSTGQSYCKFNIACSDSYVKNQTHFFSCVAWQSNAKFISAYLKKGDLVTIDGSLKNSRFVARDGTTKHYVNIVVDNIKLELSYQSNKNILNEHSDFVENKIEVNNNFDKNDELLFKDKYSESSSKQNNIDMEIDDSVENNEISADLDWLDEIED